MPLVGAAIMPHGALILDPSRAELTGALGLAAANLHSGCAKASRAIAATKPDILLLYTPHGLVAEGADLFVYLNGTASGTCEWMGSWGEHRVENVACDPDAARSLLAHLKARGERIPFLRSPTDLRRPKSSLAGNELPPSSVAHMVRLI